MYNFIVNPVSRSGRGGIYWKRVEAVLKKRNIPYHVFFTKRAGHAGELVKRLEEKMKQSHHRINLHVIILGGDGTVNEAVQGITDFHAITLSYIPTGSSNDLARDLGISRKPEEALEDILQKKHDCYMDVGLLKYKEVFAEGREISLPDRRFVVGCGMGYDAAVCAELLGSGLKEKLNKIGLGKLSYLGIALKGLIQARFVNGSLSLDGKEPIPVKGLIFMVGMIHRYEGGGFMFCPAAIADDGMLDFCLAAGISKPRILRVLPTAFKGRHLGHRGVESYRAREALLKTELPLWVHTDGEVEARARAIHLSVCESKLHMIY
ncbi:MAG: diacylglycerol kinase family lipid kinase [Lachnospiraceae bacterium]|nr:diacylglycerol kinase family lipid kinase [Lachnospiraceae bacterium]